MSSDLKYMAQTTYVILPEILPSYQIRQKKGSTPGRNRTHDLLCHTILPTEALFCLTIPCVICPFGTSTQTQPLFILRYPKRNIDLQEGCIPRRN